MYTILAAAGLTVYSEELSSLGRSDLVIKYNGDVYILELKAASPDTALAQIRSRDYGGKYRGKRIYIVGVQIDFDERNIVSWKLEGDG